MDNNMKLRKQFQLKYDMELILHSRKKGAATICTSMDGTGEHYAKWNKPGSERQIPYDLTFKWNLIQKENITRDIKIEQTDSNQRGGGKR